MHDSFFTFFRYWITKRVQLTFIFCTTETEYKWNNNRKCSQEYFYVMTKLLHKLSHYKTVPSYFQRKNAIIPIVSKSWQQVLTQTFIYEWCQHIIFVGAQTRLLSTQMKSSIAISCKLKVLLLTFICNKLYFFYLKFLVSAIWYKHLYEH